MTERETIIKEAHAIGFDAVGITSPNILGNAAAHFDDFLKQGFHGDMVWLQEKADRRKDPKTLWQDTKSIIMLGMNYGDGSNPLDALKDTSSGVISIYAKGKDYHDIVKKRLKQLARFIHQSYAAEVKVFVDTAPVMEKPLAAFSNIGWQGKHTNLVSKDFGAWLFLGAIYTSLPLEPSEPHADNCGTCRQCIDICPTNAFVAPYKMDARKCISYLTIEHKGHIPRELRAPMGNHIYGCDDCLAICPWNKFAQQSNEIKFRAGEATAHTKLSDLLTLDDAHFRARFAGSPIKRTGRDRFIRNCLIAAGNAKDQKLTPAVEPHLDDPNPIVRLAAIWALRRLVPKEIWNAQKAQRLGKEVDPTVQEEWHAID